jgi:hypothetical protein
MNSQKQCRLACGHPARGEKTSIADFPRLDEGGDGAMLCNISALLFETLQPELLQNLHWQLVAGVKKSAPALKAGAPDEHAPVAT